MTLDPHSRRWLSFIAGALAMTAALAWVSRVVLVLDARANELRVTAHEQDLLREALWRLDGSVTQLLVEESARPHFHYEPWFRAGRPFAEMGPEQPGAPDPEPSPLLVSPRALSPYKLHFQIEADGRASSPQAPAALPPELAGLAPDPARAAEVAQNVHVLAAALDLEPMRARLSKALRSRTGLGDDAPVQQGRFLAFLFRPTADAPPELCFARLVLAGDRSLVQGVWVDWRRLKGYLLERIEDLLPEADLIPTDDAAAEPGAQPLATVPVSLKPGPLALDLPGWGPGHSALAIVWVAALLAIAAAALALRASHQLGERQSRFATAVTHELRTPLTTFCMYTEMLSDGLVQGERAREYHLTLRREAERLRALVENVLGYARIEGGRSPPATGPVDARSLLAQSLPALERRAAESGFELSVTNELPDVAVARADPEAVNRILVNLVDNACKYAADASDRRLRLEARVEGRRLVIQLADHGPGLGPRPERLFRPFRRGDVANVPGLGLGLALSRGLARQMGGDLRVVESATGTTMRLDLSLD